MFDQFGCVIDRLIAGGEQHDERIAPRLDGLHILAILWLSCPVKPAVVNGKALRKKWLKKLFDNVEQREVDIWCIRVL